MKNLLFIILLGMSVSAAAQYGYGYPGGSGGVDRRASGQYVPEPKKKPKEKADMVELSVQRLNEELALDSFQTAAIKQLIEENHEKENRIISEDSGIEIKTEQVIALREKLNADINEILTPEQRVKFEEMKKPKKKKK